MNFLENAAMSLVGLKLSQDQLAKFQIYEDELLEWNEKMNLTAIRDVEGIRAKHFLDSLTVLLAWERQGSPARIIDIGTGAGFPGLVLKLIWPSSQVTLVESVHKKADFCRHMVEKLNLQQVKVLSERAETVGQDPEHRQAYDLAVARAVARMPILMEYLLPLIHRNGIAMAMKGESAPAETQSAEKAIHLLGGKLHKLIRVELPAVVEERFIVVVEKVARTPEEYPRRTGVPAKNPIQ
ncbi:MAG: 16S rRNA (guanine(527)-N(7))-methyltransferase RsmG [Anaerolineaceae bacterium]|nr:16S rRNA (guanine(527)-N(7))-methyltransferase RsmG [Anaerolineaceae bacterium]